MSDTGMSMAENYEYFLDEGRIRQIEAQLPRDHYAFLVSGSLGDVLISLSMVREVSARRVIFLVPNRFHLFCQRYVAANFGKLFFISDSVEYAIRRSLVSRSSLRPYPGKLSCILPTLHPLVCEMIYAGKLNYLEFLRFLIGSEEREAIVPINLEVSLKHNSKLPALSSGDGRKTIVVSHSTMTVGGLELSDWLHAADALKKTDIRVIFNTSTSLENELNQIRSGGFEYISLSPHQIIEAVEDVDLWVGSFSGLAAFLSLCTKNRGVLTVFPRSKIMVDGHSGSRHIVDKAGNRCMYDSCLSLASTYRESFFHSGYSELEFDSIDEVSSTVLSIFQKTAS
jgi:hypothetical protein